ncbi:MAG TPA: pitrilysin family protein [Polyangiaceae bacterium]|nr:pitrilysin family protein [Polyangiaceae bacterium]
MSRERGRTPDPRRFDLGGGALGVFEPSHDVPLVSIVFALRGGSALDPAGKSGLARLALRMLRRGCEGMTAEEIDFRIDSLGAEMAVDTSSSTVGVHAQVIARNVDAFVDLLTRLLSTPAFPLDQLDRLKRETIAEIVEARDNDRVVAQKALQRTLFEGHAYGNNAGGTTQTVAAVTRDDVVAFCRRYLVRGNVVVGLAGDVTEDRATALAARLAQALAPGSAAPDDVPEPRPRAGRYLLVVDKPNRTQTQMVVGALGTSPGDDDHVALVVANAVFGGTFTSRLMREIRSKRGWAYGASSRAAIDRHRQAWVMSTFPSAQDCGPCLNLAIQLLDAWVTEGVTRREVAFIQRYLVRSHAFDVDTAAKRLHQALDVELFGLPGDYFSAWTDHVRAVTPESANAAIRNRIRPSDLLAVVVGTASQVLDPLREAIPDLAGASVVPFDAE